MSAEFKLPFHSSKGGMEVVGGGVLIGIFTLVVYRQILVLGGDAFLFPWGSDTLGHALKVEYLIQELAKSQLYPDLLPAWYMGLQMMRYHPPLPYYLLAVITLGLGNSITAANLFIGFCAWAGGASWLLFRRWLGWGPALVGGLLFVFLPDNVRVALAEGNLPRVLATALLPATFYFLLASLEPEAKRRHHLGLAVGFLAITLSHVMMAAIYAVCMGSWVLAVWAWRKISFRTALLAIIWMAVGLALAGWWLLPSLTGGGITSLSAESLSEAQAVIPLGHYFSPGVRTGNPETIYVGMALILAAFGAFLPRIQKNGYASALAVIGILGILITVPGFNALFKALPLQNLLWPLRFLGVASFMLLLSVIWYLNVWASKTPLLAGVVVFLLGVDAWGSVPLIHLRPARPDLVKIAEQLSQMAGWRQATLDESRLGSAASYMFSAIGGREQVFGWAYQGARTASLVSSLNETLTAHHEAYLLDRLNLLGVDDVVLLNSLPAAGSISENLVAAGYQPSYEGEAALYHREGVPRASLAVWGGLGIGSSARNVAYLFPQLMVGTSDVLDDYPLAQLTRYQTVFLSRFAWNDQEAAEKLIIQAANAGVRVVVDLTGVQEDILARIPRFLDIWGEPIILGQTPISVSGGEQSVQLMPFQLGEELWYTHTPQGLDVEYLTYDYLGETAVLAGFNQYEQGNIWFVGGNLPYHAALTRDPVAIQILAGLLQLPSDTPSVYSTIPLENYQADSRGYRFTYELTRPETFLVPIAYHAGLRVKIDGVPIETESVETLLEFDAPAGSHEVEVAIRPTNIYLAGWITTGLAVLALVGLLSSGERWLSAVFKGAEPVDAESFLAHLRSPR